MMTNLGNGKRTRVAITWLVIIGLVGSLLAMMSTMVPEPAAAAQAPVSAQGDLDEDVVRAPGDPLDTQRWSVTIDEVKWDQTRTVTRAHELNFTPSNGMQWVMVKVTIRNRSDRADTPWLDVMLFAERFRLSHRYHLNDHYPSMRLPDQLDLEEDIPPGGVRSGNVAWLVPGGMTDARGCMLTVEVAGVERPYTCKR